MLPADRFDLAVPDEPGLGAVVLHPHPSYGGDRQNVVVGALFRALPAAHDQFCPPDAVRRELDGWNAAEIEEIADADHFLAGATERVADRVAAWLSRFGPGGPA